LQDPEVLSELRRYSGKVPTKRMWEDYVLLRMAQLKAQPVRRTKD
jgi:hypothetical protein